MNRRVTTRWQHNRVTLNHNNFLQNETKSHRFVAASVLTENIPFPHKDPGDSPQIMKIGVFTRNVITSPPPPTPGEHEAQAMHHTSSVLNRVRFRKLRSSNAPQVNSSGPRRGPSYLGYWRWLKLKSPFVNTGQVNTIFLFFNCLSEYFRRKKGPIKIATNRPYEHCYIWSNVVT